jgi:hypothetical protein
LASVKDVLTSILERLARRTHTAFLWEEALLVMDIENVASTFYLTITDGKFSTKNFVQFIKELLTGRLCTFGVKGQQADVLVCLKLCPIDMSSYRYAHLLIVDAIVFRQLVEIYVLGVHLHCLERVPKVGYRLAFAHHLVLSVTNVCHKSSFFIP